MYDDRRYWEDEPIPEGRVYGRRLPDIDDIDDSARRAASNAKKATESIPDILEQLRADPRFTNLFNRAGQSAHTSVSQPVYGDEPIARGGRIMGADDGVQIPRRHEETLLTGRYLEMRALAASPDLRYQRPDRIFYEQAMLMADFTDDYEFDGTFHRYYPTYQDMNAAQLRGYFSWRTRLRAGEVLQAPTSFGYVHAYELLMGIGVEPGEAGLQALLNLWHGFGQINSDFGAYLREWCRDYVLYYGLDTSLLSRHGLAEVELGNAIGTLERAQRRCLYDLLLQARSRQKDAGAAPILNLPASAPDPVDDDELWRALCAASSYQPDTSKFLREHLDDARAVLVDVFYQLAAHCAKHRKTTFVESLFGPPPFSGLANYQMFRSAVFYDPKQHDDVQITVSPVESFQCHLGYWTRRCAYEHLHRSVDLGKIIRSVDGRMRLAWDYRPALKPREIPKYQEKIVAQAIERRQAILREAAAREVRIDRSMLQGIRASAATTREALLTDEERGEELRVAAAGMPSVPQSIPLVPQAAPNLAAPQANSGTNPSQNDFAVFGSDDSGSPQARDFAADEPLGASLVPADEGQGGKDAADSYGLDAMQVALLRALLAGAPIPAATPGQPLTLVVDALNEALFDLVGDTVVEFDGDAPLLVADYADDVRQLLGE